jgi:gas vesicle protein
MGKFNKGAFLGGLLGAGFMWLFTTKKGRELRAQILDHAADVFSQVKDKLTSSQAYKDITKSKYMEVVNDIIEKYAVKNGLADTTKKLVSKLMDKQWKHIQKMVSDKK